MSDKQPNFFVRLVRGLWRVIDTSRRFAVNLIFVLIVLFLVSLLFRGGPILEERTALVLAPKGAIVEQFSADPAERAFARMLGEEVEETQLRDILKALDRAATDERIERLVLVPDSMYGAGLASLREIGKALERFRESGKPVIAYADNLDQNQFYLASFADEIVLHPEGAVLLEGLSRYRNYYREGLQDKLGVDVHLFRVGEFKSAAEPYILDAPSEESRQADLFWMTDLWRRYLVEIGERRELDADGLQSMIDNFDTAIAAADGDLAQLALDRGLVDTLEDEAQLRQRLIEAGAPDDDGETFRQVSLDNYLGFLTRETLPIDTRPQVAVVVAEGSIIDGRQPPGTVGGESTSRLLREAREDDDVKAVVLRVDSPGGGVFPSEQIRREVVRLQAAGKPVIASMGDVAASGGYWISMDADAIYADPSTITGSIGIFGLFFTAPDTLAKIGVHTEGVATTALAGAFDPRRELAPIVANTIQSVIDRGYQNFIGKVAEARGTTPEAIDQVARGRVWSGAQAHERGLVDELAGLDAALVAAAGKAGLEEGKYGVRYIEKELSPFQRFLAAAGSSSSVRALSSELGLASMVAGERLSRELARDMDLLLSQRERKPFAALAHCFCEL